MSTQKISSGHEVTKKNPQKGGKKMSKGKIVFDKSGDGVITNVAEDKLEEFFKELESCVVIGQKSNSKKDTITHIYENGVEIEVPRSVVLAYTFKRLGYCLQNTKSRKEPIEKLEAALGKRKADIVIEFSELINKVFPGNSISADKLAQIADIIEIIQEADHKKD